jgi:hypothetical protein
MFSKRAIPACLLAVCLCSAAHVDAVQMVPLKGTWSGVTVSAVPIGPTLVSIVAEGSGQVSHLGQATMVSPHTSDIATGETIGEQIFTAANGDMLTAHCEGTPVFAPDFSVVTGTLSCNITGGTGRFAGATGSYDFALVSTLIPGPEIRFSTVAQITGSISSVGSSK